MRDYQLISPSLDGILSHESMVYENLQRPPELMRIFDSSRATYKRTNEMQESTADSKTALESYFHDLYGIFMKRLSHFFVESEPTSEDIVKLMAMFQEMIKVKKLMREQRMPESK